MCLDFDELFRKKLRKVANFVKKHQKSSIWPKPCNFSNKLPCLCISMNFLKKKLQKVPDFVKKHGKPSISPKLLTFQANYDVLAFSWTFQKEIARSASFCEKARKIIDFAKTCNFSKKLPCFYVSMNFIAKSCKNCLISWKSTKRHGFGQNYATFSNKLPCLGV